MKSVEYVVVTDAPVPDTLYRRRISQYISTGQELAPPAAVPTDPILPSGN